MLRPALVYVVYIHKDTLFPENRQAENNMTNGSHEKMSLTQRQNKLEKMIRCPYGKGQVYLRNFIDPHLRQDGPQIALRCRIREYLGDKNCLLNLEEIVLTCCADPMQTCQAFRKFSERTAAG